MRLTRYGNKRTCHSAVIQFLAEIVHKSASAA
jgi:hypothetical protein